MTDTPSNPLSRLERLKRSIRRFWRTRVVGTICPWCGEREAARFVEDHWLTQGQWTHTRHGKDGWDTTFTTSAPGPVEEAEGPLCKHCGHPEGVVWTYNGEPSTGEPAHFVSGGGPTCLLCQYALIDSDDYLGDGSGGGPIDPRWESIRHEFQPPDGEGDARSVEDARRRLVVRSHGGPLTDHTVTDRVLWEQYEAAIRADVEARLEGAGERARIVLDAKNHWMTRAVGAESQRDALAEALREVKTEGKVCAEFEICEHVACQSSYSAWAIADAALAALDAESNQEGS